MWWGDKQATVDYCKVNLPRICERFGGDRDNVISGGFSRGAMATNYIGLADDEDLIPFQSRRRFLSQFGHGMGGIALGSLLNPQAGASERVLCRSRTE